MKGSSGSMLSLEGDYLRKTCRDSADQVAWFQHSKSTLLPGVLVPDTSYINETEYLVEFYPWSLGTQCHQTWFIRLLLAQVEKWSKVKPLSGAGWSSYLGRLEDHVAANQSSSMSAAFKLISNSNAFPASYCHGDLTLENVLVNDDRIVLIDPNSKADLFQSFILDLGKLLQSTYGKYHQRFNCNHGCSLDEHNEVIFQWVRERGLEKEAKLSCMSHILRLKKYRPDTEKPIVDSMLDNLLKDF